MTDSDFCAYHQPRPTALRKLLQRLVFAFMPLVFVVGLIADISGAFDIIKIIGPQSKLLTGVDLLEGGLNNMGSCGRDFCGAEFSGTTQSNEYEAVLHLAFQESAGDCLALGISVFNQSKDNAKDVRVKVSLPPSDQTQITFCDQFDVELFNTFSDEDVARKFSTILGTSTASYQISEIGPNEIAFLTVPLRRDENLFLREENGNVRLEGSPSEITIRTYSDQNPKSDFTVQLYLQKVSDISQALTDHALLWLYHLKHTRRATTKFKKFLSEIPIMRSYSGPIHTEYILGFFDLENVMNTPNYSTVRPPIVKNVVDAKPNSTDQFELPVYKSLKKNMCENIVRMEEGTDYPCDVPSNITR